MDRDYVLAEFERQIRRADGEVLIEDGWAGVVASDLDESTADEAIAAHVKRFAELGRAWEWKHYSYDKPADLADRLRAAGFTAEPTEALLVAVIDELPTDAALPPGAEIVPVADEETAEMFVKVHNEVFDGDHSAVGRKLLADRVNQIGFVVVADGAPVSGARVEFHHGTDFASLWGGGTLPAWRGRGLFKALVAHRAKLARAKGFRYLQVDASDDSSPILQRLGFVQLATTTPFTHP
ncbi:GNAT family N-acetyltransferase [Kutzneria kofuensis]|uniref:GNAT superfamily N-acetyltransferase n=1 Tax=Kutzneria kofuensis TaxID=103725 RepID=A0A7W9KEP9_9PSEU|nr:GNAT family N-acetyltransferase [Kutzneria kofuensis]MBB5891254.1 GNAT superfamily N-acetyltransferase [Kutzneria kofuensis]